MDRRGPATRPTLMSIRFTPGGRPFGGASNCHREDPLSDGFRICMGISEHSNELSFRQVACANLSRRHALRILEGEQHGRKCI
jgi:hypothetical protein